MIDFLKKYKTQIFNIITIFLILEFVIYPGLTKADTLSNILAGIGFLLLIVWGGLALYFYVTSDKGGIVDKQELKEAEQMVKVVKKTTKKPASKSKVTIDFTDAKGMNEIAGVVNPIAEGRVKISVEPAKPKPKTKKTK
jgi:hypothetical protein